MGNSLEGGVGDWGTGRLGDGETGGLGDWGTGRLGDWGTGRLGDLGTGGLGDWGTWGLGDLGTGVKIMLAFLNYFRLLPIDTSAESHRAMTWRHKFSHYSNPSNSQLLTLLQSHFLTFLKLSTRLEHKLDQIS